jgi:superfamily II DNA/RNA helicase
MQQKNYSVETILNNLRIKALNEMQLESLAANKSNDNIVLLSATGSGKTLAFLLPVVELLNPEFKKTQALIIVPSRELAQQIELVFKSMGTGFKITACYGGHKRETEENNLTQAPAIIVGTAGRLADHIRRGSITIDTIETLVMDEFDKTMESGFQEEVSFIIGSLPNIKKRILTSATLTSEIPAFIGLQDEIQLNFLSNEELPIEKLAIKKLTPPGT